MHVRLVVLYRHQAILLHVWIREGHVPPDPAHFSQLILAISIVVPERSNSLIELSLILMQ